MTPEMETAKQKLFEAIVEVDRLFSVQYDDPRSSDELLTHYIVVGSFSRLDEDGLSTALVRISGPGDMNDWQGLGLLEMVANRIRWEYNHDE